MFEDCESLTEIKGLNKSTEYDDPIRITKSMFCGCKSLVAIDLSQFSFYGVRDISYMFYGCSSLKSVSGFGLNISQGSVSSTVEASGAFYDCASLVEIDLRNFKSLNCIMAGMCVFMGCENLESIYAPFLNGYYGVLVRNSPKLKEVTLGSYWNSGEGFRELLANCPNIERLEFTVPRCIF